MAVLLYEQIYFIWLWESQNILTRHKCNIFMTCKKPGHLASRTEFCGAPGQILRNS